MIDTSILNKPNASEDDVFNCWSHTEPSDVVFCRICPHAFLCRGRAIRSLMDEMNKQEESNK